MVGMAFLHFLLGFCLLSCLLLVLDDASSQEVLWFLISRAWYSHMNLLRCISVKCFSYISYLLISISISIYLSIYLFICLSTYIYIYTYISYIYTHISYIYIYHTYIWIHIHTYTYISFGLTNLTFSKIAIFKHFYRNVW